MVKRKNKKLTTCPITGIKCDSTEEIYFIWWLEDLKKLGYVENYYRSETYELSVKIHYDDKTDKKIKQKSLLRNHVYTPDFTIVWNKKSESIFYCLADNVNQVNIPIINVEESQNNISLIEIKGSIVGRNDRGGSVSKFIVNQKWMYDKYTLYVNLIQIKKLFIQTFTPKRYLLTDSGSLKRKINWPIRTAEQYIKYRQNAKT